MQPSTEHQPAGRSMRPDNARKRVVLDREIEFYVLRQFAADSISSRRRLRAGLDAGTPRRA